jgi:antitoxin VapB
MASLISRVFNNGNSQAVRIPAEYRLDTDRVRISRNDNGDLTLHPLSPGRPGRGAALLAALTALHESDPQFVTALEKEHDDPLQERDTL